MVAEKWSSSPMRSGPWASITIAETTPRPRLVWTKTSSSLAGSKNYKRPCHVAWSGQMVLPANRPGLTALWTTWNTWRSSATRSFSPWTTTTDLGTWSSKMGHLPRIQGHPETSGEAGIEQILVEDDMAPEFADHDEPAQLPVCGHVWKRRSAWTVRGVSATCITAESTVFEKWMFTPPLPRSISWVWKNTQFWLN